jgi:hypothetical protein
MAFNATGELLTRTLNPGTSAVEETLSYNNRLQLTQIAAAVGGTNQMDIGYNYGANSTNTGRELLRTDAIQPEVRWCTATMHFIASLKSSRKTLAGTFHGISMSGVNHRLPIRIPCPVIYSIQIART